MITSTTKLLAVLGHPITHSISPQMHQAAIAETGVDATYLAFDVLPETLEVAVSGLRAIGFLGCNVTIPHKIAMHGLVDELTREASAIGAVNTVLHQDGRLIGHNTDGIGYIRSLLEEQPVNIRESHVVILGAGGAARAIACQFALEGVGQLTIVNRTVENARALAEHVAQWAPANALELTQLPDVMRSADALIHVSPVGMFPHSDETPVPKQYFRPGLIVSDTVYNPRQTRLLREAEEAGARVHSGLGMLIHQGGEAFTFWTGVEAPIRVMRQAAENALNYRPRT